jgi:hypothetical protein
VRRLARAHLQKIMWFVVGFFIAFLASLATAEAQSAGDTLRIYAVRIVKTTPFEKPFTGFGIFLGRGAVITAAHVIGRWAFLKNPRVLIAGLDLPAKVIREGSVDGTDLTLLSIDEARLPAGLQLRRSPLCKKPPVVGEDVVGVVPEEIRHYRIISPLLIHPWLRKKYNSLINEPAGSGSGIFDARRKCLLGIVSKAAPKFMYQSDGGRIINKPDGSAGYFVPASQIAAFIPEKFRF